MPDSGSVVVAEAGISTDVATGASVAAGSDVSSLSAAHAKTANVATVANHRIVAVAQRRRRRITRDQDISNR